MRQEILQRKFLERALQLTATRYRRLFETTKEGKLILDGDTGQIIDANPTLIKMLGYSHDQLLEKKNKLIQELEIKRKCKQPFKT